MIDIGINIFNHQLHHLQEEIIERALDRGIDAMILTGTSVTSSEKAFELSAKYKNILYATAGIHPHEAKGYQIDSIARLKKLLLHEQVVAVGECGLDFDRNFSPKAIQEKCFRAQIELAIDTTKPLFLHERNAFDIFNKILEEYHTNLPKAVVHCFTGDLSQAQYYLNRGYYLGFTGAITDEKRFSHLAEVVKTTPIKMLLIETDAPFMMPKNIPNYLRYTRTNEPAHLVYIAHYIAHLKNISLDELALQTKKNTTLFSI